MASSHLKGVKHATMTFEMRKALCEYRSENPSATQKELQKRVCEKFNIQISQATISKTLKRSSEYLSANLTKPDAKRQKSVKFPDLEKALYEWILQHQGRMNISGELIQEKAKDFMKKMYGDNVPEFGYSLGWVERFKSRHEIKSFRRFGESGSVNMGDVENNLPAIRQKLGLFAMKDVFNMDETRLFYRLQADHSLATKQLEGGKKDKERITVAICCNEDGSEKMPLWCIGKFAKPRCFKNANLQGLNYQYRANKRTWMTGALFEEYVRWFDKKMDIRKVLLVIDNCPAHPKVIEGLQNVELFFLPPNTTSKIQPCDAGIIRVFKMHYRRRFCRSILEGYEIGETYPEKINVLDAINIAISTWMNDVKNVTIANCFQHCKLRSVENMVSQPLEQEGIRELGSTVKELHYRNAMNVDDLLNYPGENDSIEILTDEEIIESLRENQYEDNEDDNSGVLKPVSRKEAIKAVMKLNDFLLQYERSTPQLHKALQKVRDEIQLDLNFHTKQTTVDSYFTKAP